MTERPRSQDVHDEGVTVTRAVMREMKVNEYERCACLRGCGPEIEHVKRHTVHS